ncbi:hypothetical protein SteCoe_9230 [Stentor coeruleus]|uniref:Uncharacterized protein n=1 Tax=Stentor coeruleus TaxID=5963 RepID=A0A1R2CIJ1_9CILI|nr:hypothetical protein SteCoe_9230 [Stentor coeruleus]
MSEDFILPYSGREKLEAELRLGFIRKVFGIITVQLAITTIIVMSVYLSPAFLMFLNENSWLIYMFLTFYLVTLILILCCKSIAREVPGNYICLLICTVSLSFITGIITSQYDPYSVLTAVIITLIVTISLTIYAVFTKTDFTVCSSFLCILFTATLIVIILILCSSNNSSLYYFYCWICVIIYGLYLVMDIQLIAGGRRHKLCHEDYIVGAIIVYIDIIMLFLKILELFKSK